jgi:hypothetical protein
LLMPQTAAAVDNPDSSPPDPQVEDDTNVSSP